MARRDIALAASLLARSISSGGASRTCGSATCIDAVASALSQALLQHDTQPVWWCTNGGPAPRPLSTWACPPVPKSSSASWHLYQQLRGMHSHTAVHVARPHPHQRHSRHKRPRSQHQGSSLPQAHPEQLGGDDSSHGAANSADAGAHHGTRPTQDQRLGPVQVKASGVAIPHPEKVMSGQPKGRNTQGFGYGGEDAYFFAYSSSGQLFGMGVADGVYMWREQGIDSGLMSRALMESCRHQVEAGEEDVLAILNKAVTSIHAAQLQGSTTLCMLTVDLATGELRSANLGDSGFLLVSPSIQGGSTYEVKFRSNQLEHSFGCPFQIGHHATANKVEESEMVSFTVSPHDVLVMGSDGLLDNLGDSELGQAVTAMVAQGVSSAGMAQRITHLAFEASIDKRRVTPYSLGASEAFDMVYSGGKPDDITVLVAQIK